MQIKGIELKEKLTTKELQGVKDCGYKFFFEETINIKTDTHPNKVKGIALKEALKALNLSKKENGEVISLDELQNIAIEKINKDLYGTEMEYNQVIEEIKQLLERYYNWYISQNFTVLEVDLKDKVKFEDENGIVKEISTKIDAVLQKPNGTIVGVCYSAGKPRLSYKRRVRNLEKAGEKSIVNDIRLGLYHMILEKRYPNRTIVTAYHHMKNKNDRFGNLVTVYNDGKEMGDNIAKIIHDSETIEHIKRLIQERIELIKDGKLEVKDNTYLCSTTCEYYEVCPAFIKKKEEQEKPAENKQEKIAEEKEEENVKKEIIFNEEQLKVIKAPLKPILVIAPPGSGKTATITARIKHMITHYQVKPEEILILTFTNKAVEELKARIEKTLISNIAKKIKVETYNSFGFSIVKENHKKLGFTEEPKLATKLQKMRVIYENIDNFGIDEIDYNKIDEALNKIYKFTVMAKKRNWLSKDFENVVEEIKRYYEATEEDKPLFKKLFEATKVIQNELHSKNLIDYEDQIYLTNKLFSENPDILEKYQDKYKNLLVDEYQDTDVGQNNMVISLARKHKSITVIGDEDQSIYTWRGAEIKNIIDFEKEFSDVIKITFNKNYRSKSNIVAVSNEIIKRNDLRFNKTAVPATNEEGYVALIQAPTFEKEIEFVIDKIKEGIKNGRKYSDFAIITRQNQNKPVIEELLTKAGIPVKVTGNKNIFKNEKIKQIMAMLKVIKNPHDDILALAILQYYDMSLQEIFELTKKKPENLGIMEFITFSEIIPSITENLNEALKEKYQKFLNDFERINVYTEEEAELKLLEIIKIYGEDEYTEKFIEAIKEFAYQNTEIEEENQENNIADNKEKEITMNEIIEFIRLSEFYQNEIETEEVIETGNRVKIITGHSVKGLEFPVVFIVKTNNFKITETNDLEKTEETRRLFYVAMTRAKDELYISWYDNRDSKRSSVKPIFVAELEEIDVVDKITLN